MPSGARLPVFTFPRFWPYMTVINPVYNIHIIIVLIMMDHVNVLLLIISIFILQYVSKIKVNAAIIK